MPRTRTESFMWFLGLLLITLIFYFSGFPQYHARVVGLEVVVILLLVLIVVTSFREVPAQPPSAAMPTFLGSRELSIIREGWVFVFPGIEGLIIRNYLPVTQVMNFPGLRCILKDTKSRSKTPPQVVSGGEVEVEVEIVWVPDFSRPSRFLAFLNKGSKEFIPGILSGMCESALRELAATMTWNELALSKARLSASLMYLLTGEEIPAGTTEEEIMEHLNAALTNGVADIRDMGIKIQRINVRKILPMGLLQEAAAEAAVQLLKRNAQAVEVITLLSVAEDIFDKAEKKGSPIEFDKALEIARVELGMSTETFVRTDNPMAAAAAVLRRPRGPRTPGSPTPADDQEDKKH